MDRASEAIGAKWQACIYGHDDSIPRSSAKFELSHKYWGLALISVASVIVPLPNWITVSAAAVSGFVNDFRLTPSNTVASFAAVDAEADSLGNVYIIWKNDEDEGTSTLEKRRESGELVWQRTFSTPGVDFHTGYHSVSVADDQRRIAIGYAGVIQSNNRRKSFAAIYDSSGSLLIGPVWVDSMISPPTVASGDIGEVVFRGDRGFSMCVRDTLWMGPHLLVVNFDSMGAPIAPPIQVNDCSGGFTDCRGAQFRKAQELPNGGFVVAWDDDVTIGSRLAALVPLYRVFGSDGNPMGPVRMSTMDSTQAVYRCLQDWEEDDNPYYSSGNNGDVAVAPDGRFMIGWLCCAELPNGWPYIKVQARIFDINGDPLTHAFLVTDTISNAEMLLPYAGYGNGHFYLVWTDARNTTYADGRRDAFAQKIDLEGNLTGHNYRLNDPAFSPRYNNQVYAIAPMRNGVLSLWEDLRLYPDSGWHVYGQITPDSLFGVYWPGDMLVDYSIDSQDIISLVNHIFKSGQPAMGGRRYSDISGDCKATAIDIILMVNYVFKSGPPPLPPCE